MKITSKVLLYFGLDSGMLEFFTHKETSIVLWITACESQAVIQRTIDVSRIFASQFGGTHANKQEVEFILA
jgi:hypothetical protein